MAVYRISKENSVVTLPSSKPFRLSHGPTGPAGKDGAGVNLSLDFTYSELSSVLEFGSLPVGQKIFTVHFSLTAPFNNGLSMSVGTDLDNTLISSYTVEECGLIMEYRNNISVGTGGLVKLFPYYSVAPTTGSGSITIYSI